ncbi:hypothetical protein Ancab_013684 [Ancistrocladus abbreviatus]
MGRNLSPAVRLELAKLVKDPNSRKSAMKALTLYVKDIDPSAIPMFLAQVSETKDVGSSPGEYTISLYEVLARVHGPKIVYQIDNIMTTVINTLTTSGGSFPLQQACSKVIPAIARYGIEPTTPEDKKRHIIHSLCQPLSDSLLGTQDSLSCGAALCLTALVDCPNWRFASDEMVNEVCLKLAGALEDKTTQTSSHMGLVMSLAKHNGIIIEPYARLLIQSGLRILNSGTTDRSSQKRLMAIHMIHFLMECLDIRSISSELSSIIEEMEKCLSDHIRYVGGAASEALETAMRLAETSLKCDADVISVTGSNFGRSNGSRRRCLSSGGDISPMSASPESRTLDIFGEYNSLIDSPISSSQVSCNMDNYRKGANRKLWKFGNEGVDISLKDGLFSEVVHQSAISHASPKQNEVSDGRGGHSNEFAGFVPGTPMKGVRSQSPSAQRTQSQINVDSVKIFTTPRKLIRSLQENDANSDYYENQARRFRSPCSIKCDCSPLIKDDHNSLSYEVSQDNNNGNITDGNQNFQTDSESVSSTEDIRGCEDAKVSSEMLPRSKNEDQKHVKIHPKKAASIILYAIFLGLFAVCASVLWLRVEDEGYNLVPT